MLLGNAEYITDGVTIFDDVPDDVGWTGGPDDRLPSTGFGAGLESGRCAST